MGFEYKIIAKFSQEQIAEIQDVVKTIDEFDKKYIFNNKTFWDFRSLDNKGKMPDISICFDNNGIYICRYGGGYLWKNLQELKEYIEHKNIKYTVFDYQE